MKDDEAQVHILEMLTLFWLFFMSATFIIRIHIPDSPSIALDDSLVVSGEDAIRYGLGLESTNGTYDSLIHEYLAEDDLDSVCDLIQDKLSPGTEANCHLARNAQSSSAHGEIGTPNSGTIVVHRMIVVNGDLWTLSLDVWSRGGI